MISDISTLGCGSNETHILAGEEGDGYVEIMNRQQTFRFELNDFFYHS